MRRLHMLAMPRDPCLLRWMLIGSTALVATALAHTAQVRAQGAVEAIHIEYAAPLDCPSEQVFFAQLRARSPLVQRAVAGARGRTFVVVIASAERVSTGHLTIRDAAGSEAVRTVAGDSCSEVVAALALIAALSAAPAALTAPSTPGDGAKEPVSQPPVSPPSVAPGPTRSSSELSSRASRRSRAWGFSLMANAAVVSGVSPGILIGIPPYVEAAAAKRGRFAASIRVGFERASTGALDVRGPKAHFTWTVGIVEGCPLRWTYSSLRIQPCARFEAGTVTARGTNIVSQREDSRAWLALGAVVRAQWFFLDPLFLDLEGGIRFPWMHTHYFFRPDRDIYRTPSLGWVASGGLGVRFL